MRAGVGWHKPDPAGVHYAAMCKAGEQLCSQFGIQEAELMCWVDYISIPQRNKVLQRLAIKSIAVCECRANCTPWHRLDFIVTVAAVMVTVACFGRCEPLSLFCRNRPRDDSSRQGFRGEPGGLRLQHDVLHGARLVRRAAKPSLDRSSADCA